MIIYMHLNNHIKCIKTIFKCYAQTSANICIDWQTELIQNGLMQEHSKYRITNNHVFH